MSKKSKNMLRATSIISFVVGGVMLLMTIFLLFDVMGAKGFTRDVIASTLETASQSDIDFEYTIVLTDFIVGALYNIYAGIFYLRYVKADAVLIGGYRTIMYVALFQMFFVLSIIPSVMGLVASGMLRTEETNIAQAPPKTSMDELSEKIAFLKQQKQSGTISEEQYNNMLNKLIEEEAKNKSTNSR